MKFILFLIATFSFIQVFAQRTIPSTDSIRVTGNIKQLVTLTLADLDTFPTTTIPDQIIYNHNGEIKDTLTGLHGIPLKTLLAATEYIYDKPKELNEYYFVFIASDDYTVVFSWNEIYNTTAGDRFYIVTEKEGKRLREMEERIVFMSTADLKTGRRYIKGLDRIEVRRIE